MYKSKIFANGSTNLPKPVRNALGVETGDSVCYVTSEDGVQLVKAEYEIETVDILAPNSQP